MSKLGELLRKRRKELNLAPEEIAEKIEKSVRAYKYYEEGREPRHDVLQKLARVLQFDPADIYEVNTPIIKKDEIKVQENELVDILKSNIADLKDNIKDLRKSEAEREGITKELVKANTDLKGIVQASLKTVLDNQLVLTSLFESYVKSFSELMIDEPKQQQEFRLILHKDAFARVKDLMKKGNHIDIDSQDIISSVS